MQDTYKFPGGKDVKVVRKEDIINTIKELANTCGYSSINSLQLSLVGKTLAEKHSKGIDLVECVVVKPDTLTFEFKDNSKIEVAIQP